MNTYSIINFNKIKIIFLYIFLNIIFLSIYYFYHLNNFKTISFELNGEIENYKKISNIINFNKASFNFHLLNSDSNIDATYKHYSQPYEINQREIFNNIVLNFVNKNFLNQFYNKNIEIIKENKLFNTTLRKFYLNLKIEGFFLNRSEDVILYYHANNPKNGKKILKNLILESYEKSTNEMYINIISDLKDRRNFLLNKIYEGKILLEFISKINKNNDNCKTIFSNSECTDLLIKFRDNNFVIWNNEEEIISLNDKYKNTENSIDINNFFIKINIYIDKNERLIFEELKKTNLSSVESFFETYDEKNNLIKFINKNELFLNIDDIRMIENYLDMSHMYYLVKDDISEQYDIIKYLEGLKQTNDYLISLKKLLFEISQHYIIYDKFISDIDKKFFKEFFPLEKIIKSSNIEMRRYSYSLILFYSLISSFFVILIIHYLYSLSKIYRNNKNNI